MLPSRLRKRREEFANNRQSLSDTCMSSSLTDSSLVDLSDTKPLFQAKSDSKKARAQKSARKTASLSSPYSSPCHNNSSPLAASPFPSPRKKNTLASYMKVNSISFVRGPKIFRRRSTELLLGKRIRASKSQSPSRSRETEDNNFLQSPENVRRLSDCGPVTKTGCPYKKFTDPYYIGSPNQDGNASSLQGSPCHVPDISIVNTSENEENLTPTRSRALNFGMKLESSSFDKDELQSEVQELPSNMPRRKSRTGIFDGLYTSFSTTRKLRLVHQLSMDETRSDVYMEMAEIASSGPIDRKPPLPYVGDLTPLMSATARRRFLHYRHPHSAPTSLDLSYNWKTREGHAVSFCLDSVLGPATLMDYDPGE